jgi:hypothetical protein
MRGSPGILAAAPPMRFWLRSGLAAAGLCLLIACSTTARLADILFPPAVPGLVGDGRWVSLPIGGWVTESDLVAEAIALCAEATCSPRLAIGVFRAGDRAAAGISDVLADPRRLARQIEGQRSRPGGKDRPSGYGKVSVERMGEANGLVVRQSRPDGQRAVLAAIIAAPDSRRFVLAIGDAPSVIATAKTVAAASWR